MHAALSTIVLAPASAAGLGLLAWFGFSVALLSLRGAVAPALHGVQLFGLGIGVALVVPGLLAALRSRRDRAGWQALTQWRSSWTSRELLMASASACTAALLAGLLLWAPTGETRAASAACLGLLLAVLSLGTLVCAAMVYASQKSVPAWRHPLVVPVHVLFGLTTGLALMYVLLAAMLGGQGPAMMAVTLGVLGGLLLALKWLYWHEVGKLQADPAGTPVAARPRAGNGNAGLETRGYVRSDRPFALARANVLPLRLAITAAVVGFPLVALLMLATGALGAVGALVLCVGGMLAGALLERWLFVAEARHVITVYR